MSDIVFNNVERTTTLNANVLVTGDSAPIIVTVSQAITEAATVTASIITQAHDEELAATTCDAAADDADWAAGIIAIEFTSGQTDLEVTGPVVLMIKIEENGVIKTYFAQMFVLKGVI